MSWYTVGKIKEPHALKGELYILVFSGEMQWTKELQKINLFDESTGAQTEHKIIKLKPHKKGFITKLEGIDNRNQSEQLKGLLVQIPEELLVSKRGENIYLKEILGFEVYDGDQLIGKIKSFSFNGAQDILIVDTKDNELQIPYVEEFIEMNDFENQKVIMNLPEGLTDL